MGAYSPAPLLTLDLQLQVMDRIVRPTLAQTCRTVPQRDGNDRVTWREECRTDGVEDEEEGLKLRLFGGD